MCCRPKENTIFQKQHRNVRHLLQVINLLWNSMKFHVRYVCTSGYHLKQSHRLWCSLFSSKSIELTITLRFAIQIYNLEFEIHRRQHKMKFNQIDWSFGHRNPMFILLGWYFGLMILWSQKRISTTSPIGTQTYRMCELEIFIFIDICVWSESTRWEIPRPVFSNKIW